MRSAARETSRRTCARSARCAISWPRSATTSPAVTCAACSKRSARRSARSSRSIGRRRRRRASSRVGRGRSQQVVRVDEEEDGDLDGAEVDRLLTAVRRAVDGAHALVLEDYNKGVLVPRVIDAAMQAARGTRHSDRRRSQVSQLFPLSRRDDLQAESPRTRRGARRGRRSGARRSAARHLRAAWRRAFASHAR